MKYFRLCLLLIFIGFQLNGQDLVILHTNDMHSRLNGFSPDLEYTPMVDDQDPTLGGFSRIAGFIQQERKNYEGKVVVADAGDFLMGTLFQSIEIEEGFQLQLMKKMGYDVVALGNHEFDFGANNLARIINSAKIHGDIPTLLNTNFKPSDIGNDMELQKLFEDNTILPYTLLEKNGYKLGVFALIGEDAELSIPETYKVQFNNIYKLASKTARFLKQKEKVDLVVLLSHSGIVKDKKGYWSGEDIKIAQKSNHIDIILSGHTHTTLNAPLYVNNTLITQTGALGTKVGKLEIYMNKGPQPIYKYSLVKMNDEIAALEEIQQIIDNKTKAIDNELLKPFNIKMREAIIENSFDLVCDEMEAEKSNLGPIVADAIYNYINNNDNEGVDMAIVATGVIRSDLTTGNKHQQTVNDIFNAMPLGKGEDTMPGFPLGRIYLTGSEMKKALELVYLMSQSNPSYYLYYSGVELEIDPDKGLFKKIQSIKIRTDNGLEDVSFDKKNKQLYSIGANQYMLAAIGIMKKKSYGIVDVKPKDINGNPVIFEQMVIDFNKNKDGVQEGKEWIALLEHLTKQQDLNGNGIPDIPEEFKDLRNPVKIISNLH